MNLWARLEPLVAAHNASQAKARIAPIFVELDNHYIQGARAGAVGRTRELLVPPVTRSRANELAARGVEQLADAEFSLALPGRPRETCEIGTHPTERYILIAPGENPGIPAPLAWTLSRIAMDDLDRQRRRAFEDMPETRLKRILAGGSVSCTAPTPQSRLSRQPHSYRHPQERPAPRRDGTEN